ncbi:MAG TPA: hypothetical protein VID72_04730 [Ktedonobacterales bacterium]
MTSILSRAPWDPRFTDSDGVPRAHSVNEPGLGASDGDELEDEYDEFDDDDDEFEDDDDWEDEFDDDDDDELDDE